MKFDEIKNCQKKILLFFFYSATNFRWTTIIKFIFRSLKFFNIFRSNINKINAIDITKNKIKTQTVMISRIIPQVKLDQQ